MHPVLFKIGKLSIHTYGLFVALGFISGIFIATKEAKRVGIDHEKIMDMVFYVLIAAIIGSRLFYAFTLPDMFIKDPWEIFRIWNGGLVFYGGFIFALITGIVYLNKKGLPLWKTADIVAPSVAIGHFFGRIGCFFAGCCYGSPCDLTWAVTFTNPESLAPTGVSLHPTQIYSAICNLIIFVLLWLFRRRKKFDGQLFWIYILLYGILRSFIEIYRGDFRGVTFFGVFSVSQMIGCVMALVSIIMLLYLSRTSCNKV